MHNRSKTRRLAVESVENRSLLAGNVLATVDASGLLTVTGDDAANQIYIRQLPASGSSTTWSGARYSIAALGSNNTTKINSQSAIVVEGVKSVDMAMKGGMDYVNVTNPNRGDKIATLPGSVNVDMGNDQDNLILWVENHQQINIQLGTGSDGLDMRRAIVHTLSIEGDPVFHAGDPPAPPPHDVMTLGLTAGGPVAIDSRYGNDNVTFNNFTGLNSTATLSINTGGGDDKVYVGAVRIKAPLRVETGDGNDRVLLDYLQEATTVVVNTGRGNDHMQVQSSTVVLPKLSIWVGQGDDTVELLDVKSLETVLGGGDGTDTLQTYEAAPNELGDATISGFEIFKETHAG